MLKLEACIWLTSRQKLYVSGGIQILRKSFSGLKQSSKVVKFHVEENSKPSIFRSDEILNSSRIRLFCFKFDCLNIVSPNAAFQNKLI